MLAQTAYPPLLAAWQWDSMRVGSGEYWRIATAPFVHSNGWGQILSNLAGLLVIGWLVEQQWSRAAWLAAALAGVVSGEISATFWEPVGGGISVAIGGLVGLALTGWMLHPNLPAWFRFGVPLLYVCGAGYAVYLGDIHGPPVLAGALVGLALRRKMRLLRPALT